MRPGVRFTATESGPKGEQGLRIASPSSYGSAAIILFYLHAEPWPDETRRVKIPILSHKTVDYASKDPERCALTPDAPEMGKKYGTFELPVHLKS
ncbi:hypothetical protein NECAME_04122 [Necator americanus]|uniref:Uncharacterized protein n=1 Tax=Necator americanus TaxID=51031 RepID=W2SX41_NECAM|nr:hypothetical protein NECAME_04122 [Necator americanus]ETN74093.1 hypothetical protein NECAME_04122 [Necator americanus]